MVDSSTNKMLDSQGFPPASADTAWAPRQIGKQLGLVVGRLCAEVAAEVQHVDRPQRNRWNRWNKRHGSWTFQWEKPWESIMNTSFFTGEKRDILYDTIHIDSMSRSNVCRVDSS